MDSQESHDCCGPIGVLGGTFDPIHYGHLLLAEQAREQLELARVLFIPSARPPHKLGEPVTGAHHRVAMAKLATASNPHFEVSRREVAREGPSYTIATIRELRAEGHGKIHFIVGADSALEIMTWRQPDDILNECQVVAACRPGFDLGRIKEILGEERAAKVRLLDIPLIEISSTDIRARVAAGRSIRYLVPDVVEEYTREQGLYRG